MRFHVRLLAGFALFSLSGLSRPAEAQLLTVTKLAVTTSTLRWGWNEIGGASDYQVVYGTNTAVQLKDDNQLLFEQTSQHGLSANTPSFVMVRAHSGATTIVALTGGPTVYTLARQPTTTANLPAIQAASESGVVVTWDYLLDGNPQGTAYRVRATPANGGSAFEQTLAADTTRYTHSGGITPNTEYTFAVAAVNGDGVVSTYTALGTTVTFAAAPVDGAVVSNTPSSLTIAWGANGNPSTTAYEVKYSSPLGNVLGEQTTYIPFSQNFTGTEVTLSGLSTDVEHTIYVRARNSAGHATNSILIAETTTDGGCAGVDFCSPTVQSQEATTLSGTLPNGRVVGVSVPAGAFPGPYQMMVTGRGQITACNGVANSAFDVTVNPPMQPSLPITLDFRVNLAVPETGVTAATRVAIFRYVPATDTCLPLPSSPNVAGNSVRAVTNHLSSFAVQVSDPGGSLGGRRVYPNPIHAREQSFMTFDRVPAGARVRIYTLHGEEVFDETTNASGIAVWPLTNKAGRRVASGVYLANLEHGGERAMMKLVVIR
ncbi:MAG: fibronectin type III domain-containing protein [Elusimicrobia bacterium]|nr:fibronectin type III domain-containing protein [Elusimicrobiota bacterium]